MAQITMVSGKGHFVRRQLPSGEIIDVCLHKKNVDFSRGCIAQVPGDLLSEVLENNGQYKNLQKYLEQGRDINKKCMYCYAQRKNGGKVTPKTIGKKTIKQFEDEKPLVIRLGKNTECGHYFYRDILVDFLKLCKEYKTRVIFPTKMLEFEEGIAKLLKDTKSVVNYSISNDGLEPGAVSQGFTNEWRILQAERYANVGVNSNLTLTCDITQSFEENIGRGFSIGKALEERERGMTIRLLPLRINSKALCMKVTGKKWGAVMKPKDYDNWLFSGILWEYKKRGNNEADPLFFHPDFKNLVDEGIGVCGRVGETEYCDKCNLEENVRKSFPASEIIKITYDREMLNKKN